MLSAARAPKSCPACRRQIRSLLDRTFSPAPFEAPALARYRPASLRRPTTRSTPTRLGSRSFTTTRTRSQEPPPEAAAEAAAEAAPEKQPPSPGDIELVVRQARRAFGDTLPKGYLNDDEYKLYTRLYGPPLRETKPEDVGMPIRPRDGEEEDFVYGSHGEFPPREAEDGQLDQSAYETEETSSSSSPSSFSLPASLSTESIGAGVEATDRDISLQDSPSEAGLIHINAVAKNQREFDALVKLQRDFEAASLQPPEEDIEEEEPRQREEEEEEVEEEGEEEEMDEEDQRDLNVMLAPPAVRVHAFSKAGQWRTNPSSLQLPKVDFVTPITQLLDRTSIEHVKEAAEKAFGGRGLPFSVATLPTKQKTEQKPIAMAANHHKLSEIEADAFIATMLPAMYSSTMSVLVEIRKRLGSNWMAKLLSRGDGEGPRVLDVGTAGAGLVAWEQVLEAELDLAREKGEKGGKGGKARFISPGKRTAVVGSETLRQRVSRFLHNTTFLPRLPDYLHSGDHPDRLERGSAALPRKQFDIIIASHQILPLNKTYARKAMLDNLWEMLSPEGGVLIVLEKGHPQGFQAVAGARARLLDEFIVSPDSDPQPPPPIEVKTRREREPGMIIAPCTNHKACPMYPGPGVALSRNGFCRFRQRFTRPPFLQKVLGATHRNHEDIDFSFVAVQRGTLPGVEETTLPAEGGHATDLAFRGYEHEPDGIDPLSLPRNILPPIKRQGHVILDLCTPAGKLERWTVPRSFSKQAYHDARKAQWGDLWALGAKTRVRRPDRVEKVGTVPDDGGVRAQEAARSRRPRVITLEPGAGGILRASEAGKASRSQRRTKGGKKNKRPGLMKELGLEE